VSRILSFRLDADQNDGQTVKYSDLSFHLDECDECDDESS